MFFGCFIIIFIVCESIFIFISGEIINTGNQFKQIQNSISNSQVKPHLLTLSKQIELLQNISYALQCNVLSGSSPIFFEWTKHNGTQSVKLSSSDQSLNRIKIDTYSTFSILALQHLQNTDSGRYTCTARNAFGSDSTSTNLRIQGLALI